MAKFKSEDLLNDLATDVKRIKESAEYFQTVDKNKMVYCPEKSKWSIVQVLEHVNSFNRHYFPEIERELSVITHNNNSWFSSGFFGERLVKSQKPTNVYEIKNKMRTTKSHSFPNSLNVETVLNEFLQHQDKLLQLLEMAKMKDLNQSRFGLTFTNFIKLKLGDLLRFLVAHEQRHMIQARNTLKAVGVATDKFPVILQVVPQ